MGGFEPWQAFVRQQVERALHDGDMIAFVDSLRRERWLLSDACPYVTGATLRVAGGR